MAARVRHQAPGTGLGPTNSTASKNTTTTVTFRQEPQSPRAHSRLANFRPQQAAPALRNKGAAAAAAVATTTTTTSKDRWAADKPQGKYERRHPVKPVSNTTPRGRSPASLLATSPQGRQAHRVRCYYKCARSAFPRGSAPADMGAWDRGEGVD